MSADGLWTFVTGPAAVAALVAAVLVAWPAGVRLARRCCCPVAAAVAYVLAAGVVLALTLTPSRPPAGVVEALPPHYLTQLGDPVVTWTTLTAAPADAEQWANVALYLPVGLLGHLVWHGATRAAVAGTALTVAVETCQYGIIGRAGSLTDIRNNAAGALIGAVVAAAVVAALSRARRPAAHRR